MTPSRFEFGNGGVDDTQHLRTTPAVIGVDESVEPKPDGDDV
jgi:hypothetical protein